MLKRLSGRPVRTRTSTRVRFRWFRPLANLRTSLRDTNQKVFYGHLYIEENTPTGKSLAAIQMCTPKIGENVCKSKTKNYLT